MVHRDQTEAMRSRIEALERRLRDTRREAADERARLEEELAAARAEQAGRESASPKPDGKRSKKKRRKRKRELGGCATTLLFAAGLTAIVFGWHAFVTVAWPAEGVTQAAVVTSADGEQALFVSEYVTHLAGDEGRSYSSRLAVYDLATGERRSRRVVQWTGRAGVTVLGPGPGGVWAYEAGTGSVLLDARDGSVLRGPEDLLSEAQRERLLRGDGELEDELGYLPSEEAVVMMLRDGTRLLVDGEAPRPYRGELPTIPVWSHPSGATVDRLESGEVLRLEPGEGDVSRARRLRPSGAVLLEATFVEDTQAHEPLLVGSPPGVIVRHRETLEDDAGHLISRVSLESGQPVWTEPLESSASLSLAHATAEAVVLVTTAGELVAFGIDDGAERYRFEM